MDTNHELKITTRDRVLRAWENSVEQVRDFEMYSKEVSDDKRVAKLFGEYAKDEGLHAAKLLEILHEYDQM